MREWEDASASSYTAESTMVGDYKVTVCLDDEGPMRPAYYWDITRNGEPVTDGWARTIHLARTDAVRTAKGLPCSTPT